MLILDQSSNDAEQTINILRNNGHAVRATQITDENTLEAALEQQRWDLFIVRDGLESPSAEDCIRIVQHYGRDIPFIMTSCDYSIERNLEAMRLGMQDVVPEENDEYFQLVVERELRAIADKKLRTEASSTLKEIEKRNELLLDSSRDAIAYITDGMHIYANNAYMDLFGYDDPDELSCIPVIDLIKSEQHDEFKHILKAHAKGEPVDEFNFHGVKESSETFDAIMTLTPSQYDGEDCTQLYIKMTESDDGELAERLKELSVTDRATGLYNQEHLLEALVSSTAQAANSNEIFSLAYLELDKFSTFVDEYGLSEVDNYVKQVADWLQDRAEEDDMIARVGDSTFAILSKVAKPDSGTKKAEKLREAFEEHMFEISQKTYMDTLSVGVCAVLESSPNPDKILSNVHFSCSRAHSKGGNQIKVHDTSLDALDNREDAQIAVEIQEAIESGKIIVTYEPIVKMKGSVQKLFHASLAVKTESNVFTPISDVYKIGLRTATASKLDLWMMEQSFSDMREYITDNPKAVIKLNISAASLLDESFVANVENVIEQSELPKQNLILEFNEEYAVAHLKHTITLFKHLSDSGYTLGLSEFGSSLNSTELVENIQVEQLNWLSVDHSLMDGFLSNTKSQARVAELLEFAHNHDFTTIVPDVIDAGSLAFLYPMETDHIHGTYIAQPSAEIGYNFEENSF